MEKLIFRSLDFAISNYQIWHISTGPTDVPICSRISKRTLTRIFHFYQLLKSNGVHQSRNLWHDKGTNWVLLNEFHYFCRTMRRHRQNLRKTKQLKSTNNNLIHFIFSWRNDYFSSTNTRHGQFMGIIYYDLITYSKAKFQKVFMNMSLALRNPWKIE